MSDWADMSAAYLIRVHGLGSKSPRAHLWTGTDTVCRMWSTGGLAKSKYSVQADSRGLEICTMCQAIRCPAKQTDMSEGAA